MNELFENYYQENLSQSASQCLDLKTFELAARKYRWNYRSFFASLPKDAAILDVGCGVGQFLFYLQQERFHNVIGIDISATQVEYALLMQPKTDIRHVHSSTDFLQKNSDRYDVITLNDVLEHIALGEIISFLQAVYGSLKPGGVIVIKTINSAYPLSSASRYIDLTHTVSFHEKSLTQLLHHVGFTDVRCYQEEIGCYNLLFLGKKLVVKIVRLFLKCLVYFSEADWPNIISVNIIASGRK